MKRKPLIPDPPQGLRERGRADGTVRVWWEPWAAARAMGFAVVELDENKITWSRRQAERLNADVARAQKAGGRRQASTGRTIDALIEAYQGSTAFADLKPRTQSSYRALFRLIGAKWGSSAVREFTKPVMFQWHETLRRSTGQHQAVALIRAMSILFAHAELIGWRPEGTNPCYRLKMRTPAPRQRAASWIEIDALIAAADATGLPSIGTAVALSVFQGQRLTDVIGATRAAFRVDGARMVWSFRRSKRGNDGAVQLHPECRPRVEAALRCAGTPAAPLLIEERTGRGYDIHLFEKRWAEVRAAAAGDLPALATLQFRDLRRTFGVLSRAGGATKDDAADVLGNSAATNPRLGETYMPAQIDTASRAVMAIRRPPARKTGTE